MKRMLYSLFLITLLWGVPNIWAQSDKDQNAAPDNTKVNTRDRDKNEMTADQQKVKDKSLSTYAHNVKVIARDGAVTLKGPVRSEEEKQAVEAKAVEVAGQGKVTDEISVAPKTDKK